MILLGILLAGLGLAMIVARDFMWSLTEMGNSFAGRQSERTELWEAGQILSAIVLLLVGVGVICASINQSQEAARQDADATVMTIETVDRLEAVFAESLDEWQTLERRQVVQVQPSTLGIRADGIFYGRCLSNDFFLFVLNFEESYRDFAYAPERSPDFCKPDSVILSIENSYGGGWYEIFTVAPTHAFITRTPVPTPTATVTRTPAPPRTPTATPPRGIR